MRRTASAQVPQQRGWPGLQPTVLGATDASLGSYPHPGSPGGTQEPREGKQEDGPRCSCLPALNSPREGSESRSPDVLRRRRGGWTVCHSHAHRAPGDLLPLVSPRGLALPLQLSSARGHRGGASGVSQGHSGPRPASLQEVGWGGHVREWGAEVTWRDLPAPGPLERTQRLGIEYGGLSYLGLRRCPGRSG